MPSNTTILTTILSKNPDEYVKRDRVLAPAGLRALLADNARQIGLCALATLFLTTALILLVPAFSRYWAHTTKLLIELLGLNLQVAFSHEWIVYITAASSEPTPTWQTFGWHALGAACFILLCRIALRPPFRSLFMLIGLFHLINTGVMAILPTAYPYTIAEHTRWLSLFTVGFLLLLPSVMALTHAIIERSHERRIFATLLIASYFILTLPLKLAAHAALIQLGSRLMTPTLFLAFGPAFDICLFTALYTYAATWRHNPDAAEAS
ncbi:hypothetical protein [Uliginosibacterium gangwonense]|uniref:hypothetical protein n=1 Tax=Uliginosibacterium gangwonense TaxID=392736 RepID=UPI00035FADA4|nr:hypothetical protein [Uliginosibacterium gangwonense]